MGALDRGGAEVLLLDVCRNTDKTQIDLFLLHRKGGQLLESFRDTGILLSHLPLFSYLPLGYLGRLRRYFKAHRINIIHTHQKLDAILAYIAAWGLKIPIVLTLHGHDFSNSFTARVLRYFAHRLSDKIIFVSYSQKLHYEEQYGVFESAGVLSNGIDFEKITPSLSRVSLRDTLSMGNDELLLGSVGNFTSGRDQLMICQFLSLLKEQRVPFKCVFVGAASEAEPQYFEHCVSYCKASGLTESVHFLGSRADVPDILYQLDAFLYSTVHDTFGIALIEAIAAGIPVFVNDWSVMREVTNKGAWATLFESKDDLLIKFLDFYLHRNKYREQSQKYSLQVRNRYSIRNHVVSLQELYKQLLQKKITK